MKIKVNFTTILFYFISVISFLVIAIGVSNPIISLLLLIIFSLSLYMGSFYLQKDNKTHTVKIMKTSFIILFISYAIYVISLLFTNLYFGRDEILEAGINFIPFKTIFLFINSANEHTLPYSSIITNLLGNLIAFMPLSFYLPLFFKAFKKWYIFLPTIILIVSIIEILQLLFKRGSCDIDDLILNVIGATIVYVILNSKKIASKIQKAVMF